jgi:hypothetical protein
LAGGPAIRRLAIAESGDGLIEHGKVNGIEHRLNGKYVGVLAERLHRPRNHGSSANCPVLFGASSASAQASASGNDDGGSSF